MAFLEKFKNARFFPVSIIVLFKLASVPVPVLVSVLASVPIRVPLPLPVPVTVPVTIDSL